MNSSRKSSKKKAKVKRPFSKAEKLDLVKGVTSREVVEGHRRLTHRLEYSKKRDRWSCKCGYTLGDGHEKLYARCPLFKEQEAYDESSVSSTGDEKKTRHPTKREQRQAVTTGAGISQAALDLFAI